MWELDSLFSHTVHGLATRVLACGFYDFGKVHRKLLEVGIEDCGLPLYRLQLGR